MTEANLGRFHRVDPTVVEDDPFWSVVRDRHPDVDIVLLAPDTEDSEDSGPTASLDVVRAEAAAAVEVWRLLRPFAVEAGDPAEPSIRWGSRDLGHALILEKGLTGLGQDGGTDLLRAVTVLLGRAGWKLRPSSRDGMPVLDATDGQTDVRAVAGPGATVITIATGVLPVRKDDRDTVAGGVRDQVASWQ